MAKRSPKTSAKRATKRTAQKNSLVANINKRKKSKKSRSKKDSTVSTEAYEQMKAGWPKKSASGARATGSQSSTKTAKKSSGKKSSAKKSSTSKKATKSVKKRSSKKAKRSTDALKDPAGGLTAAGRLAYNKKDGSHLKPGVKGPADTPAKMRRKGSFLRRHFATLRGPLVDDDGQPTRLALQAHAWGEPVPKTAAAAKRLADKGTKLLERYQRSKSSIHQAF